MSRSSFARLGGAVRSPCVGPALIGFTINAAGQAAGLAGGRPPIAGRPCPRFLILRQTFEPVGFAECTRVAHRRFDLGRADHRWAGVRFIEVSAGIEPACGIGNELPPLWRPRLHARRISSSPRQQISGGNLAKRHQFQIGALGSLAGLLPWIGRIPRTKISIQRCANSFLSFFPSSVSGPLLARCWPFWMPVCWPLVLVPG